MVVERRSGVENGHLAAKSEIYFDRRAPTALIEALAPGGRFHDLVPAPRDPRGPLDLHLRARDTDPQQPVDARPAHATLYLGLTRIIDLCFDGGHRFKLLGHSQSKTFTDTHARLFDEKWSRWQPLADLDAASKLSRDRFADAVIERARQGKGRYLSKEGTLQAQLSRFPDRFVVIDRESVIGYRDNAARADFLAQARGPLEQAIDQLRQSGKAWTRTRAVTPAQEEASAPQRPHSFGNELDALAVDRQGRLLAIEAKHGSDMGGVGWTPAQVAVYLRLFEAWIEDDRAHAQRVLGAMLDQRHRLRPASDDPPALSEPLKVVPVIVIGGDTHNAKQANKRMLAVSDALTAAGVELDDLELRQTDAHGGLHPRRLGDLV